MYVVGCIAGESALLKSVVYKHREKVMATIDEVDFDKKSIEEVLRVTPDLSVRTEEKGKDIRFTAASIVGERFYVGTPTQVYVYSYPDFELIQKIDSPYFNDVHHVTEIQGFIYVVSTGLDAVLKFTLEGDFVEIISVVMDNIWDKFDQDTDYRKIPSTKPHDAHPNYIFEFDGIIYVTRFKQKDAIALYPDDNGNKASLAIEVGTPHDGIVVGDKVYFTNVDGKVVAFEKGNAKPTVYDLNKWDNRGMPLGWCRGLHIEGDIAYVGFSIIRPTKFEENLLWMKGKMKGNAYKKQLPSRIAKYNLKEGQLIDEYILPDGYTGVVFSLLA